MIDANAFSAGMALLASAFKTELDAPTLAMYHRILSDQLTTQDFERGVQGCLANETWWPAPAMIMRYARPENEPATAFAWLFDDLREHGGFRFYPLDRWSLFNPHTRAGISAVGGLRAITDVSLTQFQSLRKRFIAAYAEHQRATGNGADARLTSGRDRAIAHGDR